MTDKMSYKSPVGDLVIEADENGIVSLNWGSEKHSSKNKDLLETVKQLDEYFKGKRRDFDLPLSASGTDFSCNVWKEMLKIPYGKVIIYQDIAKALKSHPRAVGMACGRNPIPILIPCHRVVGKSGKLTGYSGGEGIKTKEKLLKLEGVKNA